jgi:Tfp pilus assembly protein PilF
VQSRVFSTLGQPNWLASWLVALMPTVWVLMLNSKTYIKSKGFWTSFSLSALFFWTLIFSKSRSGFAGFGVTYLIFWIAYFWINKAEFKKYLIPFATINFSLLIICLISGTQWTPSLSQLLQRQSGVNSQQSVAASGTTALETGGTESSTIRRIVWKGATQVWLHYPIFGTGVETFAYSYYLYRPAEHNSTSEWDFIYNKAHNEYLNFAANSGTFGLLAYLTLIGFSIYQIINLKTQKDCITSWTNLKSTSQNSKFNKISDLQFNFDIYNLRFALLAGYASLLLTNFFGFSVVPTQLEFFLFPAIAIALVQESGRVSKAWPLKAVEEFKMKKLTNSQKTGIFISCSLALILLYSISKYWYADYLYATGKGYNSIDKPDVATKYLTQAISFEPNQSLYHSEIASSYARLAVAFNQQKQTDQTTYFSNIAVAEIDKAVTLSPANINLKRVRFGIFIMLSAINPNYLIDARNTLETAVSQAPTDAKIFYNLGLVYARIGQADQAIETLKKTIGLKPDYKDARLAYAFLLIDKKQNAEAKTQLEYILTNIDPTDSLTKQTLESIK